MTDNNNPLVHPDSESFISFGSKSKSNGQHYRSIQTPPSHALQSQSSPVLIQHANIHSIQQSNTFIHKTSQNNAFSALDLDFPLSKALQPLDISLTPVSIQLNEESVSNSHYSPLDIIMPPSLAPNTLQSTHSHFQYCNELNSYLVKDASIGQVSNGLNNILTEKFTEIDFEINANNDSITGVVFMTSYSVFFALQLYAENMGKDTRFEFRRTSGDSLASAKFWAMIKGFMANDSETNAFDMIGLDLQMPKMEAMNTDFRMTDTEMDALTQSLKDNDMFVVDELHFLYENMREMPRICGDILSHSSLMTQLINESLLNRDICVQRIVLLILDFLAQTMGTLPNGNGFKLFESINLLMRHERMLIRKYCIQLLADLTVMKGWNVSQSDRNALMASLKIYKNGVRNSKNAIAKIEAKLMNY